MLTLNPRRTHTFVPNGQPLEEALRRTSHLAIGAHPDDLEIMAFHGIAECLRRPDRGFTGVVVTSGSGSPRSGPYAGYTDEQMCAVRVAEQEKAAAVGRYAAVVMLGHPSRAAKDRANPSVREEVKSLIETAGPDVVYTHNPADKHESHVAVALRVLEAIRAIPQDRRPKKVLGCEVWRDLDWLTDGDKTALDVSAHEDLQAALLGVFDSQIAGGKRYDLATLGRRRAHATYHASHETDAATGLTFAMDMTPLILGTGLDPIEFVRGFLDRFTRETLQRMHGLLE